MQRMTLREAAERTCRSITTLRRYIRNGRLKAVKENGRYGPEYFVSESDLVDAGLSTAPEANELSTDLVSEELTGALEQILRGSVPLTLYQELSMKHEQLLVQYGMVRVGGMRAVKLQNQLTTARKQAEAQQAEVHRLTAQLRQQHGRLSRRLREAELELEARRLENAALKEKVRGLELLTRNTARGESIDSQLAGVARQLRRVDASSAAPEADEPTMPATPVRRRRPLDH